MPYESPLSPGARLVLHRGHPFRFRSSRYALIMVVNVAPTRYARLLRGANTERA